MLQIQMPQPSRGPCATDSDATAWCTSAKHSNVTVSGHDKRQAKLEESDEDARQRTRFRDVASSSVATRCGFVLGASPVPPGRRSYFEMTFARNPQYGEDRNAMKSKRISIGTGGPCFVGVVSEKLRDTMLRHNGLVGIDLPSVGDQLGAWGTNETAFDYMDQYDGADPLRADGTPENWEAVPATPARGSSSVFGCHERVGLLLDMERRTLQIYRDGKRLEGATVTGLPSKVWLVAWLVGDSCAVTLAAPKSLPVSAELQQEAERRLTVHVAVSKDPLVAAAAEQQDRESLGKLLTLYGEVQATRSSVAPEEVADVPAPRCAVPEGVPFQQPSIAVVAGLRTCYSVLTQLRDSCRIAAGPLTTSGVLTQLHDFQQVAVQSQEQLRAKQASLRESPSSEAALVARNAARDHFLKHSGIFVAQVEAEPMKAIRQNAKTLQDLRGIYATWVGLARRKGLEPEPEPELELEPEPEPEPGTDDGFSARLDICDNLVEMGFSRNASKRAARGVNNLGLEAAVEWCFVHSEDPDFNSPISVPNSQPPHQPPIGIADFDSAGQSLDAAIAVVEQWLPDVAIAAARKESDDAVAEFTRTMTEHLQQAMSGGQQTNATVMEKMLAARAAVDTELALLKTVDRLELFPNSQFCGAMLATEIFLVREQSACDNFNLAAQQIEEERSAITHLLDVGEPTRSIHALGVLAQKDKKRPASATKSIGCGQRSRRGCR
eukprot:COSAG06_NODE_243_length_19221_cov_15.057578_3_plen_721_part_00